MENAGGGVASDNDREPRRLLLWVSKTPTVQITGLPTKATDPAPGVSEDHDEHQQHQCEHRHRAVHSFGACDNDADERQHGTDRAEGTRHLEGFDLTPDLRSRHGLGCHFDPLVT